MLYDLELDIIENGAEVVENYLPTLFFVASQCPYSGGNAVYKARAYLENLYDTLYWDDLNVCFNEGIYKQAHGSIKMTAENIILQPNPTNGVIEIVKPKALKSNCNIALKNSYGAVVFAHELDCKQGSQFIDVRSLANGV